MNDEIQRLQGVAIAGLEERTKAIQNDVAEIKLDIKEQGGKIDKMATDLATFSGLSSNVQILNNRLNDHERYDEKTYVSKKEFYPVRNIVYGFIGLVMVAVIGALIKLVIK